MAFKTLIQTGASEDRFEKLIQERLEPGADKDKIDERIWDLFGEDWCIMFTDLSGFSRGVAKFGIIHFLQTKFESERILIPVLDDYDGILLKVEGDSFMVIFKKPVKAIRAAVMMQQMCRDYNRDRPDEEKILLCVGLGSGKVLKIGDHDVYGSEVNAASKLGEDIAKAWEILVTDAVRQAVPDSEGFGFEKIDTVPPGAKAAYKVIYTLKD